MTELIDNQQKRRNSLLNFSKGMIQGKDGKKLLEKYSEALEHITPHDMIAMEEEQLKMGITPQQIKDKIEKVMNVLSEPLKKYKWEKPQEGHPLYYLMQENRELEKQLKRLKSNLKEKNFNDFRENFSALSQMENHYLRKENILFPYLERVWKHCRPLAVMWSLHDDIRMSIRRITGILSEKEDFDTELYDQIGNLFFLIYGMIFKEELVIYPAAMDTLPPEHWRKISAQSSEIGYSLIEPPATKAARIPSRKTEIGDAEAIFETETGSLSSRQIEEIFNSLPIDLTFIDEKGEVKFFSKPKDRFFTRSPAIIGRKVQKCHPPESVHVVQKILDSFKSGDKDEASFHIQMKGKFIFIRYFAIRSEGEYLGTLEVSQDVTQIRKLKGEKRLLDWE